MKEYYECHITFQENDKEYLLDPQGWIYSRIDGDPVLGWGIKAYYTKLFKGWIPLQSIKAELDAASKYVSNQGYTVLRTKIERIVYDSKQDVVV